MKKILFFAFIFFVGLLQAQQKSKSSTTKKKTEKEWVNPVKLTKEEHNRPYMDEVLKTRDSLTPKEAERRRKNIAIGNPFAKEGYYPKIATLSRGKYLEFHDKDSIVVIGSIKYNTKQKKVIEILEIDLSDPDAQPIGDTHGMWMSPDPLSEEFPSWSPYNYAMQNPIRNIDPDGRAPFDWVYNFQTNSIYWNDKATSQATAGANETYLGKSGTYTAFDGSTTMLHSNRDVTNNSLLGGLGLVNNLDPLIQAGASGPTQSVLAFGVPGDGSYIRATPNSNSPEVAMGNPSGRLAVAGLYGLQGAAGGIGTEMALAKVGLAAKLSWSGTSIAGEGLGGLGVQTSFSSGGISMGQAFNMVPANFNYLGGLNKGEGFKFADPTTRGSSNILLEYGNPASKDILHSGPYIKINQSGSYIERIPLKDNPVLNIGR